MIAVSIPAMAKSLGQNPLRLNLVIATYLLSLAVFIPVSGWIADRLGARIVFCSAIAIFTAGSALCGLATDLPMLLAMRVIQGFGGAMMTPVGRLILLRSFPRSGLVSAMNWMTIPAMIGPTAGPIVGGFVTSYFSWRAIFFLNLPIGVAGVLLSLWLIENFRAPAPTRFDLGGFVIAGTGLALLELAIENLGRPIIPGGLGAAFFPAALVILAGYRWHAARQQDPVLDLGLLRIRTFRIGTVTGGFCRMGLDAVPFLLPLLFQVGFGLSPVHSGLLTFSSSLGAMFVRMFSGPLLRFFGFRRLLVGIAFLAAAVTAGCGLLHADSPVWVIVLLGAALGMRAQRPLSRPQYRQLRRCAGRAVEQEHQRQRRRPAGGARFWRRRRRGPLGGDRRAVTGHGGGFQPRLFPGRADPAGRRARLFAPDPGRWRRCQRPRRHPAPRGVSLRRKLAGRPSANGGHRRTKEQREAQMTGYAETYRRSIEEPEEFWAEAAAAIDWERPWDRVLDTSRPPFSRWFPGARLNTCWNALDRHVAAGSGERMALIWDSPAAGEVEHFTYRRLRDAVARLAGVLAGLGVVKGDRVLIYMPMVPQAAMAMLACARIGAVHSVVFGGFAAHELATRIDAARPRIILSASCGIEVARIIPYKPLLDAAIAEARVEARALRDPAAADVPGRSRSWPRP